MSLETAFDGAVVRVYLGNDTAEAARMAAIAGGHANAAALSEAAALAAGRYYSTIAAGIAATTVGQMFTSDEGGTWNYYVRTASSPFFTLYRAVLGLDASGNLAVGGGTISGARFTAARSISGGNPVNVGTVDANVVLRSQGNDSALDMGAYADGSIWQQGRRASNLANQFGFAINPNGGNVGIGIKPLFPVHAYGVVPGGTPATSGAVDSNVFTRLQGSNVAVDLGVEVSGQVWMQPRFFNNFGSNFNLALCPNGGDVVTRIVRPETDNARTLGTAGFRWTTVFATTGTINTSDERQKTWRGPLTEAELRAARRIVAELGFFQWNDAIAEKGADGARYHFGVRAQAVWRIMADEGLVDPIGKNGAPGAARYAFLCFDAWEAEFEPEMAGHRELMEVQTGTRETELVGGDGKPIIVPVLETVEVVRQVPTGAQVQVRPAGNAFGLRIDQLTLFLIAAQEARLAALEAR